MSIEVDIEHPVAQTHTHNGLARSIIKCLQSIPHTNETKLPTSTREHVIMNVATLIHNQPILTINTLFHNLYLENNQMYLSYGSLIVQFMY